MPRTKRPAHKRAAATRYRTPAQARKWLRDNGISVTQFAREHGVSRDAMNDLFRGKGKGSYGAIHKAAVALGMKPAGDADTNSHSGK